MSATDAAGAPGFVTVKPEPKPLNDDHDDLLMAATGAGKMEEADANGPLTKAPLNTGAEVQAPLLSPRAKEIRLDQNRKAARESRRRKKVMLEELQRSVIFFSRANSTLKAQNEELTRMLLHAQSALAQMSEDEAGAAKEGTADILASAQKLLAANAKTDQGNPAYATLPPMQPGATMQAMSNFQQAATAAMQAAMQGLQTIPGINLNQLTAAPAGANAQQAYTDTMTALAMQQAAMAAAGHPFGMQQGGFPQPQFNPYMWPPSTPQQAPVAAAGGGGAGGSDAPQDGAGGQAKQG